MRILVCPNTLDIGGSQLNAVELAECMQVRGHDVTVLAPRGPLGSRLTAAGVSFVPAPARPRVRPSPSIMRLMRRVVVHRGIDIVHGYEWPPILEAFYGCRMVAGTPMVGTVMSMGVAPFIPADVPLVVGTHQIAEAERSHRPVVHVLEPPVDTEANRPGLGLPVPRRALGWGEDHVVVVIVSRLARELKREGILAAVDAVGDLAETLPVRLAVVGDGPARREVEDRARGVNARAARTVVAVVGAVEDPRPWYDDADISLGMGGSALRAMAFATPLVVQGERGFWELLTDESLATFQHQGWYGVGAGDDGASRLQALLRPLVERRELRQELGLFARRTVVERFSLEHAADLQEDVYRAALRAARTGRVPLGRVLRPSARLVAYEVRRRQARLRGRAAEDDFNAIAVQPASSPGRTTQ